MGRFGKMWGGVGRCEEGLGGVGGDRRCEEVRVGCIEALGGVGR